MLSREDFVYLSWLIVDLSGTRCPVVFTRFGVFHAKSFGVLVVCLFTLLPADWDDFTLLGAVYSCG